ncbi:tetratricopeptide repeat protein [Brevundimonas sp. M20]|uniref:tetratricopeptide repeat protein n=1 Tax=Brevundimonas sp. M20 TaxID=2591463 RepID=UPI0011472AA7|nr:tetratricopeptide repeat protein [Brevundimonas sp. M20]QDH73451.1 tetratricopeptide repeat protein [Brevundimonas sp. M20]
MSDVFEQVEEELRSERYKRLARVWLPIVGGVLVVALIGALAFWGWQSWETSKADKASIAMERGLESLQSNNPVGADAAFAQAAKEGNSAYKALALQHRAGIALDAGRDAQALAFLDEAAAASRDPLISGPAAYKALLLAMDIETLEQVTKRAEALSGDDRPFNAFAQEALALALLQHGKPNEAKAILVVLKNDIDTPPLVSQHAQIALDAIDSGGAANVQAIVGQMAAAQAAAAPNRAQAPAQAPAQAAAAPQAPQPAAPARP